MHPALPQYQPLALQNIPTNPTISKAFDGLPLDRKLAPIIDTITDCIKTLPLPLLMLDRYTGPSKMKTNGHWPTHCHLK